MIIGDEITTENGVRGRVVSLAADMIVIEAENGKLHYLKGQPQLTLNTKFTTESDALIHAVQAVKKSHCQFCGKAKLYSLELLDKELLESLFPKRGELCFKGVVNFLGGEYSSCCYHLLPQIEGSFNKILHDEGLLSLGEGFPRWRAQHPGEDFRNKPCKNVVHAIKGAEASEKLSKLSHVRSWLGDDNIAALRGLRNKLLHGSLTMVSAHDAALVVTMIQCIKHGLEGET
ncbi:hypothetical protein [Microbulbifer yueqingensis]|uniref:hypothetical protein n=1 Tax=Microbulbifer yueqingensis TaxID=658219 RepID=UPI00111407F4|nr:hypothetical protein [Microbulbifer yueqingensis]